MFKSTQHNIFYFKFIGIFSIFLVLNYTFIYNGIVLAIVIGVLSALFVKYLFDFVFPKPLSEDNGEDI